MGSANIKTLTINPLEYAAERQFPQLGAGVLLWGFSLEAPKLAAGLTIAHSVEK
jgi:hypothetical protein